MFLCLAVCSCSMTGVIYTIIKTVGNKWNFSATIVATDEVITSAQIADAVVSPTRQRPHFFTLQYPVARYLASLAMARTSIFYLVTLIGVWVTVFVEAGDHMWSASKYQHSYDTWTSCIFSHFDGSDESWQSACGLHPRLRLRPTPVIVALTSPSILIAIGFLPQFPIFQCITKTCHLLWRYGRSFCAYMQSVRIQLWPTTPALPSASVLISTEDQKLTVSIGVSNLMLDNQLMAFPVPIISSPCTRMQLAPADRMALRNFSSVIESVGPFEDLGTGSYRSVSKDESEAPAQLQPHYL